MRYARLRALAKRRVFSSPASMKPTLNTLGYSWVRVEHALVCGFSLKNEEKRVLIMVLLVVRRERKNTLYIQK